MFYRSDTSKWRRLSFFHKFHSGSQTLNTHFSMTETCSCCSHPWSGKQNGNQDIFNAAKWQNIKYILCSCLFYRLYHLRFVRIKEMCCRLNNSVSRLVLDSWIPEDCIRFIQTCCAAVNRLQSQGNTNAPAVETRDSKAAPILKRKEPAKKKTVKLWHI